MPHFALCLCLGALHYRCWSKALSAEGLAADVTMLVGNGYVPGHAAFALDLIRTTPSVRQLFERRVTS